MPDLLLELFSEEIPARMQQKAAGDLKKRVTDGLLDAGLTYEAASEYWTPRRLTLDVRGVTPRSADIRDERKGPRVDAPDKAVEGFLRGAGLSSRDEAEIRSDPKKGDFYVAVINKPGRAAEEIIGEIVPEIIRSFQWPKSMRWGEKSAEAGSMRWVRPLQSILCTFGPETEEPIVVNFEVGGVASSNITYGHRFHAPSAIKVRRFDDYISSLEKAKVVLSAERRQETILADAKNLAFAQGLELVEDQALLTEVANLVEWPVVLMGEFDESFLDIPDEVVQLTIRTNQKCFVLRSTLRQAQGEVKEPRDKTSEPHGEPVEPSAKTAKLTNRFLLVSNIEAHDNGAEVASGNGKVVAARLSDAKFFWESDLAVVAKDGFEPWVKKLDTVTFHAKLGTQGERVERIMALARELAPIVGANPDKAERAAELAKADLGSAMVYEFPEVQGLMGRTYAEKGGEDASVAAAIEEHYKPQGPSDDVPSDPVSIAVALADKLDTLVGFWAIDEKPTGSKDPFALRRAALGVIRLVLENGIDLDLTPILIQHTDLHYDCDTPVIIFGVIQFLQERLKVQLRSDGTRHDLVDAVFEIGTTATQKMPGMGNVRNLLQIVRRVEALGTFLETDDGVNLLTGTKRAANFLSAEEKKKTAVADNVDPKLFQTDEERALFDSLEEAEKFAKMAIEAEDFEKAMGFLSQLRAPVDNFFEHVMVNDEDEKIRANRLALMRRIRAATETVADFSKIAG